MNHIIRVTFGETSYFAKVLTQDKYSFTIETLFPVQGILYSETSRGDYNNVKFFEESVLKAFKTSLIFKVLFVLNNHTIKQRLRELEFSLMIFIDDTNSPEKNRRIKNIFGNEFLQRNFPHFEYSEDMVNYLVTYLDFKAKITVEDKTIFPGGLEAFLEAFKLKSIHSISNHK